MHGKMNRVKSFKNTDLTPKNPYYHHLSIPNRISGIEVDMTIIPFWCRVSEKRPIGEEMSIKTNAPRMQKIVFSYTSNQLFSAFCLCPSSLIKPGFVLVLTCIETNEVPARRNGLFVRRERRFHCISPIFLSHQRKT